MTRNPSKQWFKGTRGDTEVNLEAVSVVAEMEERRYSEGGIDRILIGWEGKKEARASFQALSFRTAVCLL